MAEKLQVIISSDTRQLTSGLKRAQSKLKSFSTKLSSIGSSLQSRLALPLAAAGGASIKMAADFDKSMTKIKTLVGVAANEVDAMSGTIKQLATQAGVSSGEAAEAMFFITSAGLRGADAMNVLEQATKASAVGLGDTKTVADLATSALNAYGVENLSASEATDVLTAAVREGKLESSELAGAMGRVLPIASNMGVSFHEVGAAFAAMSRTGTNANEAATQLRGILNGILKPTNQAADMLESMGLSSQSLRQSLKEDGLLATLEILKQRFEGNDEAAQAVFGNVRALTGIMDLLGASVDNTRQIFSNMTNVSGTTSKAFDQLQNSAEFKLRKGLVTLKNSFTELGSVLMTSLLPAIQNALGFVTNLFKAFTKLDPATQQIAIGFGALAVALPTILSVGGSVLAMFSAMASPIGLVAAGVAAVAYTIYKNWNEVLPVIVGLYNRFVDLYNSSKLLRVAVAGIKFAFQSAFIIAKAQIDRVINAFSTMWKLIKEFSEKGFSGSFTDILKDGFDESVEISKKAGEEVGQAFTDAAVGATEMLEHKTVEQVKTSLSNAGKAVKGMLGNVFGGVGIKQPAAREKVKSVNAFGTGGGSQATAGAAPTDDENKEVESQWVELGGIVQDGLANLAAGLATGKMTMGDVAGGLLSILGDIAIQLGKAALKIGVGMLAVQMAFANPLAAIAAGTALILIGSVMKNMAGSFSGQGAGAAQAFANGGIVSGPTLGLIGEYSGARSNPEVVAPLDKLKGMIGQEKQRVQVGGQFRVQGQDLVLALQRADKNRNRLL